MKKKNNSLIMFGAMGLLFLTVVLFMIPSSDTSKLKGSQFLSTYASTPGAVLLDVRTPEEFAAGHIKDAVNIDFENQTFLSEIQKLDTAKTYFVYCRSSNRSGKAITLMKESGIKNIYELQGGIILNKDTVQLVTGVGSVPEYVVDSSDMVNGQALVASISAVKKSELTEQEKLGLIQMREEEKLARDVYTVLGSTWGINIFSNIAASEQTHTDAVKVLLTRYGIDDPVTDATVGVFSSKAMQELYNKLVTQGKISQTQALVVGATIEDLDIYDLEKLKKETNKEDILLTYNNLQKGSRNHMRAFVRSLGTYTPQYISQADYSAIINSPQERGRQ